MTFGYQGTEYPGDAGTPESAVLFAIAQLIGRIHTATLARVESVTNDGGVSPVGFVDLQPLVNQIDGEGNGMPHGMMYGIPYFRLQGGTDAVILDPKVGDIGIVCVASRDISNVKKTKRQSNPGSWRQFSLSDGIYWGGILNGAPVQFIEFEESGVTIRSPSKVTIDTPETLVTGNLKVNGNISSRKNITATGEMSDRGGDFTMSGMRSTYNGHTHNETGDTTGMPNQAMASTAYLAALIRLGRKDNP